MFTKRTITLAALILAGATSAALAYEDPENKIGDRYPFLEQRYMPVATPSAAARHMMMSRLDRQAYEDSENKIGDRYPFLEQSYAPTSTGEFRATRVAAPRSIARQYANDVPENKIGDRYPYLEQPIQSAGVGSSFAFGGATRPVHSTKMSGSKSRHHRQTAQNSR